MTKLHIMCDADSASTKFTNPEAYIPILVSIVLNWLIIGIKKISTKNRMQLISKGPFMKINCAVSVIFLYIAMTVNI